MIFILSLIGIIIYLADMLETIKGRDIDYILRKLLTTIAIISILIALIAIS
jgi:hypothetical protein